MKNSDIDDFIARANAVDEAIKGMRDGTVNPDTIKIDGIDCDTQEVKDEKEVQMQIVVVCNTVACLFLRKYCLIAKAINTAC